MINFKTQDLTSGRHLTALALYREKGRDGVMYGERIELKNVAGQNIPGGALLYVNSEAMRVTLYDDYTLDHVGALYQKGSSTPRLAPATEFKEMSWKGEGGEIDGQRHPAPVAGSPAGH